MEDWIPGFVKRRISKVGAISRYWSEQCQTPWTAIMETIPGAAAKPVIGLLSFGLDDVLRGYLRPRGLKPGRKFAPKKRFYNRPTIPELGEEIGKRIPGAETIKGRQFGAIEKFLWIADGAMQRALYYVMVFDAVLDTWYNSVSALRKQGYCSTSTPPKAHNGPRTWIRFTALHDFQPTAPPEFNYSIAGPLRLCRIFARFEIHNPNSEPITEGLLVHWQGEADDPITELVYATIPAGGNGTVAFDKITKARPVWNVIPAQSVPSGGWTPGVWPSGVLTWNIQPVTP